jgi:hypothetical protein
VVIQRALAGEEQGMWDLYSTAITYAYNTQVHASTWYAPFDLILSRPPPPAELHFSDALTPVPILHHPGTSALFIDRTAGTARTARATGTLESRTPEPQALRDRLRQRLAILLPQVLRRLRDAGIRYKRYADLRAVPYNPYGIVGKRVALRRNLRLNKLEPYGLGVYHVAAAGDHTVTIATVKGPVKISKDRILQALDSDRPIDRRFDLVRPSPSRDPVPRRWPPEILDEHNHVQPQRNASHVTLVPTSTLLPNPGGKSDCECQTR